MPRPPLPRNAIEIPLYTCAMWGVWPPLRVLLGLPYSDLDERLRPSQQRIVVVGSGRDGVQIHPEALERHGAKELSSAARGVDFVVESDRATRRGPKRSPNSMQLIPDIGIDHPSMALAWMLVWRDLAIVAGRLGHVQLKDKAGSWRRNVISRDGAIRKQKERIRRHGGDLEPRWRSAGLEASARNAIIAARGTAARLGGEPTAPSLLERALERYDLDGLDPATVPLPAWDSYRYHPAVRDLARFFTAGEVAVEHGPDYLHRVLPRRHEQEK